MLQMEDSSQLVCCQEDIMEFTLEHQTPESFGGYLKNVMTNLTYNLKHSNYLNIPGLLRERIILNQNDTSVYLLGREYTYYSEEEFILHFQNTIWFSYRKNIPVVGDDRGWGCMIRSGMMMVAEALKRATNSSSSQILKLFSDKDKGPYSFTNLCKIGQIDKRWTTASEIMHICDQISRQDKSPKMNIINVPISCFMASNIEEEIMKRPHENTLIVLHTKLGINNSQQIFLPHLKSLMKIPYFCGLLGGVPREAMYIVGFKDDKVISLDPHYVQEDSQQKQSYFKKHPRGLDYQKLSSCLAISFMVSNLTEFHDLVKQLFVIDKQTKQNKAMGLHLPANLKKKLQQECENELKKSRKMSADDFQILQ